jgi:hypothetical protein
MHEPRAALAGYLPARRGGDQSRLRAFRDVGGHQRQTWVLALNYKSGSQRGEAQRASLTATPPWAKVESSVFSGRSVWRFA